MIKLVIALEGDNEQLARGQLADLLTYASDGGIRNPGQFVVYRAWSERIRREAADHELAARPLRLRVDQEHLG